MAYTLPDFNLTCDILTFDGTNAVFRLSSPCNLAVGRRVSMPAATNNPTVESAALMQMTLLVPAGTDLRDASCNGWPDVVEVPQGSGRTYFCYGVDDLGKGFPNEHRFGLLWKAWDFPGQVWVGAARWPTPIP